MRVILRPGTPADAGPLAAICHAAFGAIAGRHAFPTDFPTVGAAEPLLAMLLARDDVHAVVAEADGRPIGSNFLWETAPVAGVGPITVDPAAQDRAVGRRLMEAVLERARERRLPGVRLCQAAYHNRSLALYTRLGFDAREPLTTLQGPALGRAVAGLPVRPATAGDVPACNALHHRLHGFARTRELLDAIDRGTAAVVERDGRITGYTTGIGFFGHAVGESNAGLEALIAAAPSFTGPGFLLPTRNGALLRWCLERGLRVVQPMTLMSLGLYSEPKGAFLPSVLY